MPSHKVLKSVVRSLAESFTSLMNYYDDDYVMGHIVRAAWLTGGTEFHMNLLMGNVSESSLLVKPVADSVGRIVGWFPDIVSRSRSSMEFITSAELTITLDPIKRRQRGVTSYLESPYICTVRIIDDRGKIYSHTISDWWYPENQ